MRTAAVRGSVCYLIRGSKPRDGDLGGLVGISFILLVTTISSLAGPANGLIHPSHPAFSMMVNNAVAARGRLLGHALRVAEPRTQAATPQGRAPVVASQSLSSQAKGTTSISPPPNPISPPANPISPPHNPISPPANPIVPPTGLDSQTRSAIARSETADNINHKFEQAENKARHESGRSPDRQERLERSRAFFISLIDVGYPLPLLDTWCDDLLDDQVDAGMPIDLVDSYWGQPISTQQYVEYYTPYQVCTYQTPDGNYRQVTFQNGVVSQGL
jgi:hypothetical protein